MIHLKIEQKKYNQQIVLKGVDLSFKKGKAYGVIGPNGAGKTTLFRCMVGLESFEGNIEYLDKESKKRIGYLPTYPYFLSRITGWEYLKLVTSARKIRHEDFYSQNIFDLPLDQYVEYYSSGMKKKMALLGLLLQENEIYILDEPYNGVDLESNILINKIIAKLKSKGKTIILSSHILDTMAESCDSILLLENKTIGQVFDPTDYGLLKEFLKGDQTQDEKLESLKVFQ